MATVTAVFAFSKSADVESLVMELNGSPLTEQCQRVVLKGGVYRTYWSFSGNPGDTVAVLVTQKDTGKVLLKKTASVPGVAWGSAAGLGRLSF